MVFSIKPVRERIEHRLETENQVEHSLPAVETASLLGDSLTDGDVLIVDDDVRKSARNERSPAHLSEEARLCAFVHQPARDQDRVRAPLVEPKMHGDFHTHRPALDSLGLPLESHRPHVLVRTTEGHFFLARAASEERGRVRAQVAEDFFVDLPGASLHPLTVVERRVRRGASLIETRAERAEGLLIGQTHVHGTHFDVVYDFGTRDY